MTLTELESKLSLKRLTSGGNDREIASCYISDLLSRVLGGCQPGDVWITVQISINMVAVAVMVDAGCVILPEDLTAPANVIEKADEEDLVIFTSSETAYTLAKKIAQMI